MSFDTERFIIEVENRPCLWDTKSNEYSDRILKVKAWEEMVEIFKDKDDLTAHEKKQLGETLQKKWKSVRGCYTREVNRLKALKSGSGAGPRKSEYIYFNQLQFLKRVVAIREPDPVVQTSETVEDSQKERRPEKVPQKRKIKDTVSSEDDKIIETLNKSIHYREIQDQDDDRLFLLSLVKTLKQVPEHRKMSTKIKIMSILDEETRFVGTSHGLAPLHNWSQSHIQPESQARNYRSGYSTVNYREQPAPSGLSNQASTSADINYSDPPSNLTDYSEASELLDLYN